MKQRYLFTLLLLFSIATVQASHIVGGEFSMRIKGGRGNMYQFNLHLYFDVLHGDPLAEDEQILAAIYSKATHQQVDTLTLYKILSTPVSYSNPLCATSNANTKQIQYSRELSLDPAVYNEAQGYYIVWERCCRNEGIVNILAPEESGMTFYMEFSTVTTSGSRLTNNSPEFTPLIGNYACVNENFTLNFSATDADKDQLVYTLVTPLKGHSSGNESAPAPLPAPYPSIDWKIPYDLNYLLDGSPSLQVDSTTGKVTFKANKRGLYAFAVLCEEYRNGNKIGEVRREYQIHILDCQPNTPPVLMLKREGKNDMYQEGSVITLQVTDTKCFDILITDQEANTTIQLSLLPANFPANKAMLTPATGTIPTAQDTLRAKLCLEECIPYTNGETLAFFLIARDSGCPDGEADTLHVQVIVKQKPNIPPQITTTLTGNQATLWMQQENTFEISAFDADNESIALQAIGKGFNLGEAGMQVNTQATGIGSITIPFYWKPDCHNPEGSYTIDFIVTDNSCSPNAYDTTTVSLILQDYSRNETQFLPPNVFTPNADHINDFFEITDLPADNCKDYFTGIVIYNRWGKVVFEDTKRSFRWKGENLPTGTYFYLLQYSKSRYKGIVSLLR